MKVEGYVMAVRGNSRICEGIVKLWRETVVFSKIHDDTCRCYSAEPDYFTGCSTISHGKLQRKGWKLLDVLLVILRLCEFTLFRFHPLLNKDRKKGKSTLHISSAHT